MLQSFDNRLVLVNALLLLAYVYYSYAIQQEQFFPLCVALYRSRKVRWFVLANMAVVSFNFFLSTVQVLFGDLHYTEALLLYDVRWPILMEMSSTFIIFQSRFNWSMSVHFLFLCYFQALHYLLDKRIEQVNLDRSFLQPASEQREQEFRLHTRIVAIITFLALINTIQLTRLTFGENRLSLLSVVLIHRYIITTSMLIRTLLKYILNIIDNRYYFNEWHEKILYESIIQTITTLTILASNLWAVIFLSSRHIRAVNLFRYLIQNGFRFWTSAKGLYDAVKTISRIDSFPTPSVLNPDDVCPICLADMEEISDARILPACRHVFHYDCLKRWARRSQVCPTCRTDL